MIRFRRRKNLRRKSLSFYPQKALIWPMNPYDRKPTAGVNGESSTRLAAPSKGHPSANLGRILQNRLLMAPMRLFLMDQGPSTNAAIAKFGCVSEETVGNDTMMKLRPIAR